MTGGGACLAAIIAVGCGWTDADTVIVVGARGCLLGEPGALWDRGVVSSLIECVRFGGGGGIFLPPLLPGETGLDDGKFGSLTVMTCKESEMLPFPLYGASKGLGDF